MQPKVLVAGNLKEPDNYLQALCRSGMEPFYPLRGKGNYPAVDPAEYDALLVPGGGDVHPQFYGEKKSLLCMGIDEGLDAWEAELIRGFIAAGKPIFGICRGCQMINVTLGGTLVQHIVSRTNHVRTPLGDAVHKSSALAGGFVAAVYGEGELSTNSSHHQCVGRLAEGLKIVQVSVDGIPEAVEHTSLPIWAVQWHPERMAFAHRREDTVDGAAVFAFFREKIEAATSQNHRTAF